MKKLFALAIGSFFAFALFEGGLALLGLIDRERVAISGSAHGPGILCVGNSHTAGWGAPPGLAYPAQLQRELDASGVAARVFNGGLNNANTAYMSERLERNLERFHPRLILLMAGESNLWNRYRYPDFVRRSRGTIRDFLHTHLHSVRFLEHLLDSQRRFGVPASPAQEFQRLLHLADQWLGERDGIPPDLSATEKKETWEGLERFAQGEMFPFDALFKQARIQERALGDPVGALRVYEKVWARRRPEFTLPLDTALRRLGRLQDPEAEARRQRLIAENLTAAPPRALREALERWERDDRLPAFARAPAHAEEFYRASLRYRPGYNRFAYLRLAESLRARGEYLESVRVMSDGFRRSLYNVHPSLVPDRFAVPRNEREGAEYARARAEIQAFYDAHRAEFDASAAADLSDEDLYRWIEADFTRMLATANEKKARLVLLTYPPYPPMNPAAQRGTVANAVAREFARRHGLSLFDTEQELLARFAGMSAAQIEAHYADPRNPYEQHLNAKGYGLLAQALKDFLLRQRLLAPGEERPPGK